MSIPKPGKPVRGSTTGAPIMALFDLLGRRWAMGVVWQLSNGPLTFRALQEKCGNISPSILNSRLKDLKEAKLIERTIVGYQLTAMGRRLFEILEPFKAWTNTWNKSIQR
jgi:DNA-binding HxlR family transcriptional regulator